MKILSITVLGLGILGLLQFSLGEVNRFKLTIDNKGTQLSEEIDIDERRDVGVFRVPAHNDIEGAEFYHNFKMRVTVTRILSRKACYISELDSAISSPAKLKEDISRAASQVSDLPNETESSLVMITGPANRRFLTKEILDFCGALRIYSTEHIKIDSSNGNETTIVLKRRHKRDLIITEFISCLPHPSLLKYVENCMQSQWDIGCVINSKLSILIKYVTCSLKLQRLRWECKGVQRSYRFPTCCDYICAP